MRDNNAKRDAVREAMRKMAYLTACPMLCMYELNV